MHLLRIMSAHRGPSMYSGIAVLSMLLAPGLVTAHHSFGIYSDEVS
ncbi:MAG: hypothetical protein ACJ0SL_06665 [Candidatus Rariloculaceae bacterium]